MDTMIMDTMIMAFVGNIQVTIASVSPLFVWSAIVIVLAALIILCIGTEIRHRMRRHRCHTIKQKAPSRNHFRNILQMGSEREEMFVPGDTFPWRR